MVNQNSCRQVFDDDDEEDAIKKIKYLCYIIGSSPLDLEPRTCYGLFWTFTAVCYPCTMSAQFVVSAPTLSLNCNLAAVSYELGFAACSPCVREYCRQMNPSILCSHGSITMACKMN